MRVGRAIDRAKEDQPREAARAGDDDRGPPAPERARNREDETRRDRAAHRRSAVEERDGPAALAARKPFGDRLGGAGPVRRLGEAEQKTERGEAAEPG